MLVYSLTAWLTSKTVERLHASGPISVTAKQMQRLFTKLGLVDTHHQLRLVLTPAHMRLPEIFTDYAHINECD